MVLDKCCVTASLLLSRGYNILNTVPIGHGHREGALFVVLGFVVIEFDQVGLADDLVEYFVATLDVDGVVIVLLVAHDLRRDLLE